MMALGLVIRQKCLLHLDYLIDVLMSLVLAPQHGSKSKPVLAHCLPDSYISVTCVCAECLVKYMESE